MLICNMSSLLINLIFLIAISAADLLQHENVTYEDLFASQTSGRLKRVPFHAYNPPDLLKTVIKDGEEEIYIEWHRVKRYLVNENLPVYTAHLNSWGPNHKKSDVMKELGELVFYHSKTHFSTLILIREKDKIFSIIDNRYIINGISIDQLSQMLEAGGPYLMKRPDAVYHRSEPRFTSSRKFPKKHSKREVDLKQFNKTSIRINRDIKSQNFYVEILVFVTYDIYMFYKNQYPNSYLRVLMIHYLIHFNSVDMAFSILPKNNLKIFINLAGLIIEAENGVFNQITKNSALEYYNNGDFNINNIFKYFKNYPNHFDFPFTKDSFDYVLILTGRYLSKGGNEFYGEYWLDENTFDKRMENEQSLVPMAVNRLVDPYGSYCRAVQSIGRVLGIKQYDPPGKGITEEGDQCYGIMQESGKYCPRCIKWSKESIRQLEEFTRCDYNSENYSSKNPDRCFLLNKPRSVYPPGTPIIFLSPCGQCQCFGFGCYKKENPKFCPLCIPANQCAEPLICSEDESSEEYSSKLVSTILPLDGTPCGENKVCWDEKCVDRE